MSNHLIIGLGGTGGKVIRSFRKAIFQEFRQEDPDGVHIAYIYMDSSGELMDLNDPTWKVLGQSVQLGQNSQVRIGGADLQTILDNIQNFPGIKGWIGDRNQWRDILNSIVGETLGGQKRRLGRFLFANRVDDFNQRLRNQVNSLQGTSGTAAITFHICCGLAGGTGSGSLIDVIAQIRHLGFQDHQDYRVILYTLLPDANPPQNWNTGNYHANGLAALKELNGLSIGALNPHDLTGSTDRLHYPEPFNGCYVFTNRNENGMTVDVNKVMPDIVADFLYQKIVSTKDVEEWPQQLMKMENAENGDGTPETAPGSNTPERSKRFLTFGIKRLAVPEEEILEYMTYSFTSQAALQLLYNNWQDGLGFQDEPRPVNYSTEVQQNDTLSRWRLTDAHVCLSLGILEADANNKKLKPISNEWQDYITNARLLIRESMEKPTWIDNLEKMCAKRFAEEYRGFGVAKFYETKLKGRRDMAKEICGLVESNLFDDWRNGVKSMHEVSRLMEDLISTTEDRIREIDDKRARLDNRADKAQERIKQNGADWAKIGLFGKVTGKRDNVFDAHAGFLQEYYICRTWLAGWDFGRKLLEEVKETLTELKSEVDESFSRVRQANSRFQAKIESRCNDDETENLRQHLIRYYSPELVKTITSRFVRDESIQGSQTSAVRSRLVNMLGEYPGFRSFNRNVSSVRFMDTLETECEKSVQRNHDAVIQNSREKLLGVSIIERLKNQFSANPDELKSYVADLVKYAGNYVTFSDLERNKRGEGIPASPNCVTEFTAILPRAPEHEEFMKTLKKTLVESRSDRVNIVETDAKPNEITLITITNLFPLRFLKPLDHLQKQYDQRIKDLGKVRATLEVHIEGDGSGLPPLFVESVVDTVTRGIPYVLMAKGMEILVERENQTTGDRMLSIITKDEDGFDNEPIDLGASLEEVPDNLNPTVVNLMRDEVVSRLSGNDYSHKDNQQALITTIGSEIDAIKAARGVDNDIYKTYLAGAKEAARIIKGGR